MSKITQAARGRDCTIRLGGICNFNAETSVFCHLSGVRFRKGIGNKVSDALGAIGCSCCHDAIDGRVKTAYTREELLLAFYEGCFETQLILIDLGLIKI